MLDRGKLAKILGLLGSDKTGEILSAARAADALIRNANTSWAEVLKQNAVADDARAVHTDNEARTLLAEYEHKVLALGAENDKLRETVTQLSVENDTLREQAARRLAHRILDGVKRSGRVLLAPTVVFDGIAFRRGKLAARLRNNEFHTQRVVLHGLAAAGIALAIGIVAILSLQDVAILGGPSVRSLTVASSGHEAPEPAGRLSGLPAEAEWRGDISAQSSSAAMVAPETMPQPPPPEAGVAPAEDTASQPAIPAVAAPGRTAREAEAPPSVTSPAPAKEQATPPAISDTTSPPPTQPSPNRRLSAAEIAALVTRGDTFLRARDIVSARLFYERAADGEDGDAALRLGATFDPGFLSQTGDRGALSDRTQASFWYRRALDLGNAAAQEHLKNLERERVPQP
jgi:hypothetical protein